MKLYAARVEMQADAALFAQLGRNAFLAEMKIRGLDLDTRSKLADFLDAAIKDGSLTLDGALGAEFEAAAAKMPPIVKSLLVENADPSTVTVEALLSALNKDELAASAREADVLHAPAALSPKACAALRSAVDCERRLSADSVDTCPEHQLNLSVQALELLIGAEEAARLMRLPREFRQRSAVARPPQQPRANGSTSHEGIDNRARAAALRAEALASKRKGEHSRAIELLNEARGLIEMEPAATAEEEAQDDGSSSCLCELQEMFVRRYTMETRPWIGFHTDAYEVTCNVALSDDDPEGGGRLLGVYGGAVQSMPRSEGSATVHSSKLLHAVASTRAGQMPRYSLIIFFDRRARAGRQNRWTRREPPEEIQ